MSFSRCARALCMTLAVASPCLTASLEWASPAVAAADLFAALKIAPIVGGDSVPAFELKGLDGTTLGSKDLAGQAVLLNFWATWCGPCKEEMPSLARLQQQLDPRRFRVVTITADRHPEGIRHFLGQLGIGLPVLFDEDQEVARQFMVRGLPTTILLGQDGRPVARAVGPRAWDSADAVAVMQRVFEGGP